MKPTAAVRYPTTFPIALPSFPRGFSRFGQTAYMLSLAIAGMALVGSVFYKEISRTFTAEVFGFRAVTLWETGFGVAVLAWLVAMTLSALCLPQKGRPRTFGVTSIGMNLAAALLVACTL